MRTDWNKLSTKPEDWRKKHENMEKNKKLKLQLKTSPTLILELVKSLNAGNIQNQINCTVRKSKYVEKLEK